MPSSLRLVAYNFLVGGSARRCGHWSRVLGALAPDVLFGQECRPPEHSHGERFRPGPEDALLWQSVRTGRWGSALLVRSGVVTPLAVPQFEGWVVGGEVPARRWSARPIRFFSVHTPAGERGYVKTMHEILDRLAVLQRGADLVLGGDFNVAVGYRPSSDPLALKRSRQTLLDRLAGDFGLHSCWQSAHPGRPLAQTLRWSANPRTPYHCDGIFVPAGWTTRITGCRVVRGSRWDALSDHSPVFAEIRGHGGEKEGEREGGAGGRTRGAPRDPKRTRGGLLDTPS